MTRLVISIQNGEIHKILGTASNNDRDMSFLIWLHRISIVIEILMLFFTLYIVVNEYNTLKMYTFLPFCGIFIPLATNAWYVGFATTEQKIIFANFRLILVYYPSILLGIQILGLLTSPQFLQMIQTLFGSSYIVTLGACICSQILLMMQAENTILMQLRPSNTKCEENESKFKVSYQEALYPYLEGFYRILLIPVTILFIVIICLFLQDKFSIVPFVQVYCVPFNIVFVSSNESS